VTPDHSGVSFSFVGLTARSIASRASTGSRRGIVVGAAGVVPADVWASGVLGVASGVGRREGITTNAGGEYLKARLL